MAIGATYASLYCKILSISYFSIISPAWIIRSMEQFLNVAKAPSRYFSSLCYSIPAKYFSLFNCETALQVSQKMQFSQFFFHLLQRVLAWSHVENVVFTNLIFKQQLNENWMDAQRSGVTCEWNTTAGKCEDVKGREKTFVMSLFFMQFFPSWVARARRARWHGKSINFRDIHINTRD